MTAQALVRRRQPRQAAPHALSMPAEQLAEQAETRRFATGLALAMAISLPVWGLTAVAIFG